MYIELKPYCSSYEDGAEVRHVTIYGYVATLEAQVSVTVDNASAKNMVKDILQAQPLSKPFTPLNMQ